MDSKNRRMARRCCPVNSLIDGIIIMHYSMTHTENISQMGKCFNDGRFLPFGPSKCLANDDDETLDCQLQPTILMV